MTWLFSGSIPEFTMIKMAKTSKYSSPISKPLRSSAQSAVFKINSMKSIPTISLLSSVLLHYLKITLPTWMEREELLRLFSSARTKNGPNFSWAISIKSGLWGTMRMKSWPGSMNSRPSTHPEVSLRTRCCSWLKMIRQLWTSTGWTTFVWRTWITKMRLKKISKYWPNNFTRSKHKLSTTSVQSTSWGWVNRRDESRLWTGFLGSVFTGIWWWVCPKWLLIRGNWHICVCLSRTFMKQYLPVTSRIPKNRNGFTL